MNMIFNKIQNIRRCLNKYQVYFMFANVAVKLHRESWTPVLCMHVPLVMRSVRMLQQAKIVSMEMVLMVFSSICLKPLHPSNSPWHSLHPLVLVGNWILLPQNVWRRIRIFEKCTDSVSAEQFDWNGVEKRKNRERMWAPCTDKHIGDFPSSNIDDPTWEWASIVNGVLKVNAIVIR